MTRPWALILHYLAAGLARPAPRKVLLPPLTVEHFSAKCLDSTSAGFFLREQDPSKWIIMIDGGGLCIDALDCRKRAETDHGSSSQWPATWDPEAVPFSGGEASFANYSQVFVPYCSGDLWLGRDRERRLVIGELQMSGHLILDAVVEHLVNTTTLRTASSVVFAGSSAGGIGVFHHADWITTKLQAAGATLGADGVVVLPMAGLFFPMEWPVLWEEFRWGLEVPVDGFMASWCHLLEESFLHEGCVSAATAAGKPKRECQDVSKILPYIKAQVFMLQNQFDQPDPPMCLTRMPLAQSAQLPPQLDACGFELDVLAPQLGSGAYAAVRKLRHRKTGREMALKIVEKQPLEIRQMLPQMQRELGIQGALRHKHLLRLMSIVEDDRYIYMLLEFCGGGTLRSLCQAQPAKRLAEPDAARLIFQILQGVDHMHSHGFVHRDLKADNILLSLPEFDVRICDFGWSAEATLDKLLLTTCGTPEFWAPEQWSRAPQSYSTDCWALGCLFYEVLVGHPPFWGSHEEIKEKVLVGDARYPPFLSQAAMSLLHCHLQVEPQHRAPCSWSMQKHEFLEDERQRASSSASDLSTKSGSGPSDEELEELSGAFAPAADAS